MGVRKGSRKREYSGTCRFLGDYTISMTILRELGVMLREAGLARGI